VLGTVADKHRLKALQTESLIRFPEEWTLLLIQGAEEDFTSSQMQSKCDNKSANLDIIQLDAIKPSTIRHELRQIKTPFDEKKKRQ